MPFFSVVIPTFNQCNYLKKAIESVLAQQYKNYEIIIIDNNSKDETKKVIKSFKSKKIVYRKINNKGIIAKSRNLGIKVAKGKWIALLDSDDFWHEDKLKDVFNIIKKKEKIDVICNDKIVSYDNTKVKKIYRYGPYKPNFYEYLLKNGNRVSTSASVVKKYFLTKNNVKYNENKKFVTTEDYDFFLNIARKNGKFYFYHKVLGGHLIHKRSASSNYLKHKKALEAVYFYHVFNLQKFYANKKELWKNICYNIDFDDMIYSFKEYKLNHIVVKKIIKLFFNSPTIFFKLIILQIYNSLFNASRVRQ